MPNNALILNKSGKLKLSQIKAVRILEKYFRIAGAHSTILGLVVGLDVDCRCGRILRFADLCGLAVGTADTVALRSGSADDELEVGG